MTPERWAELQEEDEPLTPEEITEGWHWCWEFDGLLVGPGSSELHCCQCLDPDHPVYKTTPPLPTLGTKENPIDLEGIL